LELKIRTNTGEQIVGQQQLNSTLDDGFLNQELIYTTPISTARIAFVNFASFLRNDTTESDLETIPFAILANESNSNTSTFVVLFPDYFVDVVYDPDFGVLLGGASSSGVTGDGNSGIALVPCLVLVVLVSMFFLLYLGGDGTTNLGLIIGVSVGVPVALVIVLFLIIAGTIAGLYYKRKRRKLLTNVSKHMSTDL